MLEVCDLKRTKLQTNRIQARRPSCYPGYLLGDRTAAVSNRTTGYSRDIISTIFDYEWAVVAYEKTFSGHCKSDCLKLRSRPIVVMATAVAPVKKI